MGELAPGRLADVIVLDADPLADLRFLCGGKHLTHVIKDGRVVNLGFAPVSGEQLALKEPVLA